MPRSASASLTPAADYARHRPEEALLYGIVETYYPQFLAWLDAEGGSLPAFVKREFEDYLKCGLLEHGFLRVKRDARMPRATHDAATPSRARNGEG